MSTTDTAVSGQEYLAVQASPEFQELRSRLRRFVFPMSAVFLLWYSAYVVLGAFAHDFMAIKVWGDINVGLIIGLGQFVSTFIITGDLRAVRQPRTRPARQGDPRRARGRCGMTRHHSRRHRHDRRQSRRQHRHLRRSSSRSRCSSSSAPARRTPPPPSSSPRGRSFTGPQNGIAISGDYLSAASFLGIAGAIAVYGYDGFLYSIGFLVAWLVALLLVAELLRNAGKFTMADVLSFRLKQRPVRMAAATTTLAVCLFYLLAQMAGAGGLVALLLEHHQRGRAGHGHRRRRPADDRLRADRRHEGHHLGADHQGGPADRRRRR